MHKTLLLLMVSLPPLTLMADAPQTSANAGPVLASPFFPIPQIPRATKNIFLTNDAGSIVVLGRPAKRRPIVDEELKLRVIEEILNEPR